MRKTTIPIKFQAIFIELFEKEVVQFEHEIGLFNARLVFKLYAWIGMVFLKMLEGPIL